MISQYTPSINSTRSKLNLEHSNSSGYFPVTVIQVQHNVTMTGGIIWHPIPLESKSVMQNHLYSSLQFQKQPYKNDVEIISAQTTPKDQLYDVYMTLKHK